MISMYKQIECDSMYTDEAEPFTNGINKASILLRIQGQGVFLKNYHVQVRAGNYYWHTYKKAKYRSGCTLEWYTAANNYARFHAATMLFLLCLLCLHCTTSSYMYFSSS